MVDTVFVENEKSVTSAVSWPAIFVGAVVMTALSMAFLALGSGIGFSASSHGHRRVRPTAPRRRR
jgi:hypothetical protein